MKSILDFLSDIDDIYGVFLDANRGFDLIKNDHIKMNEGISPSTLKQRNIFYGVGNPNKPSSYPLHKVNQYDYFQRNSKHGKNRYVLANQSIVQIYQYWEDMYRSDISKELGIVESDLKNDVFGDLRIFRQSIIHNHGIAISNVSKCKVFGWFKHKEPIKIDSKMFEEVIRQTKITLNKIMSEKNA